MPGKPPAGVGNGPYSYLYSALSVAQAGVVLSALRCPASVLIPSDRCVAGVLRRVNDRWLWHQFSVANMRPVATSFVGKFGWVAGTTSVPCGSGTSTCAGTVVLATSNGGASWAKEFATRAWVATGLQFVDPTHGFMFATATGGPQVFGKPLPALYQTADGGATWNLVNIQGYSPTSISFPTSQLGWLSGVKCTVHGQCQGAVLATRNGGASWSVIAQVGTFSSPNSFFVDFTSASDGWLMSPVPAGGCNDNGCFGSLSATSNGGQSWTTLQPTGEWPDQTAATTQYAAGPGFPLSVDMATSHVGWIPVEIGAGPGVGGVEYTSNGGVTFRRLGVTRGWSVLAFTVDPHTATAWGIVQLEPSVAGQNSRGTILISISLAGIIETVALPQ